MVVDSIDPEARRLVREHQQQGHVMAIVSGATRLVVGLIAQRLGIPHHLYPHLEVEDGRFTGRAIELICCDEGKIYWLQQFIEEHGIDLARSFFYSDSITDLPLLEFVGHPAATNPDPFLTRTAAKRSSRVLFFAPPSLTRRAS